MTKLKWILICSAAFIIGWVGYSAILHLQRNKIVSVPIGVVVPAITRALPNEEYFTIVGRQEIGEYAFFIIEDKNTHVKYVVYKDTILQLK